MCEIHICDEEGEEVPVGESGTIFFGGGGEFEYHKDDEKTKGSRHPKGWSTLGDVGYLDDDETLCSHHRHLRLHGSCVCV